MSESYRKSPEKNELTFATLHDYAAKIRGARLADRGLQVTALRHEVQALYGNATYEELRAVYSQMCMAYRSNEDPQSENFDPAVRSAWIELHSYLEQRFPEQCERGGELFAIDVSALEQQAVTQAEIGHGTMSDQRAMPQRIEPHRN